MAVTNHERIGNALDLLRAGLGPFVEREIKAAMKDATSVPALQSLASDPLIKDKPITDWDVALLLKVMWESWNEVFRKILGPAERGIVGELRGHRNKWAHQEAFTSDDAYRALDSAGRLLTAVSAPQSRDLERIKMELLRVRFDEQARNEKRKAAGTVIESHVTGTLKPWREVVSPHRDVASGRYQQAEFAADLWQVHIGEGVDEYRKPVEFFRRTFLTDSLQQLLVGAVRRLSSDGGDPVIQLQTNFGGGKTHSMLALYHLFSGATPSQLLGVEGVMKEAGSSNLPAVKRVVLVGNKISPGNPVRKDDGTFVHTLWGELAWQLGGRAAYDRIRADDEKATSPGDAIRDLFNEYGPTLVLIDEWVAYARQLHDQSDLPAGSFETHFTFAQALTESAKLAKHCLLVVSLPASDTAGSPHTQADDVEVGGRRGREALDRLRNAIGRLESSWRPASAEEGFEIVRRRLFEPLIEQYQFVARDTVARAYFDLYRSQHQEFPPECRDSQYEERLKAAYPIHPEVFDRLYTEWSTLVKFQRTRGVLRLMAAVIHSLWEKGDRNSLIQPASIPIDDPRVQFELTRYLSDNWTPIIEKDVDGPNSLPLRMDGEVPNLGKFSACRRIARTIYLGSAPGSTVSNRGIEDRRIKLGCVMPSESPAIFGDALRRLSGAATYLYQDGARYWYSTQPTVTKLAEDRTEQLKSDPDRAIRELDTRLRADLRKQGDFAKIHALPQSGQDVPDDFDARLVVLGADYPHSRDASSAAMVAAKAILETRGSAPRLYRNTLVFLAADKTRLQDLDESIRRYLAWQSVLDEKNELDLTPYQVRQAEAQKASADSAANARLPEAFQWLLVPQQPTPQSPVEWRSSRLSGQEPLAARASRKLKNDELLVTGLAGTRLRLELDQVPLWRGDDVSVKQLVEDFARYLYLPRLRDTAVLIEAIREGLGLLTWGMDSFAYAESYDEAACRYRGLRCGQMVSLSPENLVGLLVRPELALKQQDDETSRHTAGGTLGREPLMKTGEEASTVTGPGFGSNARGSPTAGQPKRFHGSVTLDATRVGRDASHVADEVISHLSSLIGANVRVTLEIEATIPNGTPDNVVRTVTENSRTLKFDSQGFEQDQ
jgi:predicted AAA+ superfamily ATPase